MPQANNDSTINYLILGIVGFLILIAVLVWLVQFLKDFFKELTYVNMEIERTEGSERRYWKRQKRRLWLSLIPFVKY